MRVNVLDLRTSAVPAVPIAQDLLASGKKEHLKDDAVVLGLRTALSRC